MVKILSEPEFISDIFRSANEYYFRYGGHAFSVLRRTDDNEFGRYSIYVYPKWKGTLEDLAVASSVESEDFPMAAYHQSQFKGADAYDYFAAVYQLMENRQLGLDDVFDDILRR